MLQRSLPDLLLSIHRPQSAASFIHRSGQQDELRRFVPKAYERTLRPLVAGATVLFLAHSINGVSFTGKVECSEHRR